MKIVIPDIDGRAHAGDRWHDVIDTDRNEIIGRIRGRQGSQWSPTRPSWEIELFNGQHSERFDRLSECKAFAKGIESAINCLMPQYTPKASKVA